MAAAQETPSAARAANKRCLAKDVGPAVPALITDEVIFTSSPDKRSVDSCQSDSNRRRIALFVVVEGLVVIFDIDLSLFTSIVQQGQTLLLFSCEQRMQAGGQENRIDLPVDSNIVDVAYPTFSGWFVE